MNDGTREVRDRLKVTFDSVAERYHQARPAYPDELFAELIAAAGLRAGDRMLEVGCGTGKATIPLAERGFAITCLEPGPRLAVTARRNLARFPHVHVVGQAFEDWQPSGSERFALIFAATAWHWIDPAVGYQLAWRSLRPGHVFPSGGDPFFHEIQEIYDEIGEGMPAGTWYFAPGEQPDDSAAIAGSGLFTVTLIRHFDWEISYTAEGYIELLNTFSSHIDMADWQRDRLYGEIRRRLADRPDGKVRRHWGATLQVATRRDEAGLHNSSGPESKS